MDIRPIRNDDDHGRALREIERLWGARLGTPDGDRLDVLATLVERYEELIHPVPTTDPVGVLRYAIDEMGRSEAELGLLIGRTRASEILSRKRKLTLALVRTIAEHWRLPIEALAADYALAQPGPARAREVEHTTP